MRLVDFACHLRPISINKSYFVNVQIQGDLSFKQRQIPTVRWKQSFPSVESQGPFWTYWPGAINFPPIKRHRHHFQDSVTNSVPFHCPVDKRALEQKANGRKLSGCVFTYLTADMRQWQVFPGVAFSATFCPVVFRP